ncbi:oligopeptide transport system permease protein [Mycoplasma testudineum]|uniref:Oligopeptide transport system permease protein n=1 Tax=Mycoplasma testudineum TaxID=244584 RepID=A0A4R6IEA2_9MOLU|nr:ABC transporter permease [Mycoplasma testudineum]OYD26828.1 hypothetical protein CG473_01820 [Mycoplasma testudineum]TDO20362.1 oligopeptide transport system permease protein [Mycoplasma testudineum]
MDKNEFNKAYNLGNLDKDLFKKIDAEKVAISEIVGKPKRNLIEIFKRFFSNPFYAISFVIFVTLLILAIIVTFNSPYDAESAIVSNLPTNDVIYNLPPSWSPMLSQSRVVPQDLQTQISLIQSAFPELDLQYVITTATANQTTATWNAYVLIQGMVMRREAALVAAYPGAIAGIGNAAAYQIKEASLLTSYFGTDLAGIDVWTRTGVSITNSLGLAFLVSTITMVIGSGIGIYLGFHVGTWIDTLLLRIIEIFTLLPVLVFFVILTAAFGTSFWALVVSLIFVGWADPVRTARLYTIILKDREFVVAAQSIGASKTRRIIYHILPAILGKLINVYVLSIPGIIFLVSSLAFLGFFNDPNAANLGNVLRRAATPTQFEANLWALLLPAGALLLITLSLQFVAVGFHDALDPRLGKAK